MLIIYKIRGERTSLLTLPKNLLKKLNQSTIKSLKAAKIQLNYNMAKCFRIKVYGQHNFVKKPLLYRGKALSLRSDTKQ